MKIYIEAVKSSLPEYSNEIKIKVKEASRSPSDHPCPQTYAEQ